MKMISAIVRAAMQASFTVLVVIFLSAAATGVAALEVSADALARGKVLFEKTCSRCHEIERPLARDMERADWEKLLIDMASRGAEVEEDEKKLILDYLATRYVFTSKCTGCHAKERIFDRERAYADWMSTVKTMAAKSPELLTEEEAAAIASYLTLVLGPQE